MKHTYDMETRGDMEVGNDVEAHGWCKGSGVHKGDVEKQHGGEWGKQSKWQAMSGAGVIARSTIHYITNMVKCQDRSGGKHMGKASGKGG